MWPFWLDDIYVLAYITRDEELAAVPDHRGPDPVTEDPAED